MDRENSTRTLEEIKTMNQDEFRQKALELDKNDKLTHFREQFEIGEEIYLDGNSLGRLPKKPWWEP
jgi:kynureninase